MSGEIITVFRSRLRADGANAYFDLAPQIAALASTMPGFLEVKGFEADDGERVTIVTFTDRASHNAWRDHPEHRAAMNRGVAEFYDSYSIHVAEVTSTSTLIHEE